MSLIKQKDSLSCKEIDFTPPITRVIVFLKDEVLLNKIVSKKSRLKDILISGNLDPNGNYILEGKPLDTRKTIIELIPKDSEQLIEIKLFIQLIKLDLQEDNKEIYFSPILKPFENPFRILVFSPDEFTTTFKKYSQNTLKHFKLENFSDTAAAYCNTDKGLYISGGKNKGKGTKEFIKICKFKLTINSLPEIPVRKEYHSMIFVPNGEVIFEYWIISITKGALLIALQKALVLSTVSALSQCATCLKPGRNTLLGLSFEYYSLMIKRFSEKDGSIINKIIYSLNINADSQVSPDKQTSQTPQKQTDTEAQ